MEVGSCWGGEVWVEQGAGELAVVGSNSANKNKLSVAELVCKLTVQVGRENTDNIAASARKGKGHMAFNTRIRNIFKRHIHSIFVSQAKKQFFVPKICLDKIDQAGPQN